MSLDPKFGLWLAALLMASQFPLIAAAADSLEPPVFSVPRGHYQEPFELIVSTTEPGAGVFVTIDGTEPGPDAEGSPASVRLAVSRTMSVRAVAVAGDRRSAVITHSYVFPTQVLRQTEPAQPAARWGHSGADWEVDPDVVEHRDPESRFVAEDLLEVPALVIALPFADFWGDNGIYIEGEGEPRAASVELLNPAAQSSTPNKVPGFQVEARVEITGGSSTQRWKTDKLSMRLKFHHEADFPVFEHASAGRAVQPALRFHTLVLDARLNESWTHPAGSQREQGQYVRDQFMADLHSAVGGLAPHGRHVHLYIAGMYWGVYNLHERPDHHFASHYLGGEPGDYDVIKHQAEDVVHGSNEAFLRLRDLIEGPGLETREVYAEVSSLLDVEQFVRYILLNLWAGNTDWSHQNWYASFNRASGDGRWRFHTWDAELTLRDVDEDITGKDDPGSPTGFHRRLMRNPDYRSLFISAVDSALEEGGLLDPAFTVGLYRQRIAEVDRVIRAESARWGDNRRWRPYLRGKEWVDERDRILTRHLPDRTAVLLEQLRAAGWYP